MFLGKVIGTVVAEQKYPGLQGAKLMVIQPLDHRRQPVGGAIVAVDTVQAGPGDLVYLAQSREAAHALPETFVPVDAAVIGIVDQVEAQS